MRALNRYHEADASPIEAPVNSQSYSDNVMSTLLYGLVSRRYLLCPAVSWLASSTGSAERSARKRCFFYSSVWSLFPLEPRLILYSAGEVRCCAAVESFFLTRAIIIGPPHTCATSEAQVISCCLRSLPRTSREVIFSWYMIPPYISEKMESR